MPSIQSVFAKSLLLLSFLFAFGSSPIAQGQSPEPVSFRGVVKSVLPAVVSIEATAKQATAPRGGLPLDPRLPQEFRRFFEEFSFPFDLPDMPSRGVGSGFIVDPKGVVITNHHVVKGASEVTVRLQDGRTFQVTDIKSDSKTDLAVLRFDAKVTLPSLEFADSSAIEAGDRVLAFGSPFGLAGSVTTGIISGKGRKLNNTIYEDFLQTDAAINPGNSGGPLVNLEGKVVGVNTAIRTNSGGFQGVGLAIASNVARDIVAKLLKEGSVRRGYLGVQVQSLDSEIATRLGVTGKTGVVVAKVVEGSPADQAGLQAGDVVTALAGSSISDPADLQRIVTGYSPKQAITVSVLRDGQPQNLSVTIGELPDESSPLKAKPAKRLSSGTPVEKLGISLADSSPTLNQQYGFAGSVAGVFVTDVDSGSPAAQAGLQEGVLLAKIDGKAVTTVTEALSFIESASLERGVLLQLRSSDGRVAYVMIRTGRK